MSKYKTPQVLIERLTEEKNSLVKFFDEAEKLNRYQVLLNCVRFLTEHHSFKDKKCTSMLNDYLR